MDQAVLGALETAAIIEEADLEGLYIWADEEIPEAFRGGKTETIRVIRRQKRLQSSCSEDDETYGSHFDSQQNQAFWVDQTAHCQREQGRANSDSEWRSHPLKVITLAVELPQREQ